MKLVNPDPSSEATGGQAVVLSHGGLESSPEKARYDPLNSGEKEKNARNLIYLISCAVSERAPGSERVREMDLPAVYALAEKHMVTAAAAIALESAGFRDQRSSRAIAEALFRAALFEREQKAVQEKLEEAGIPHMPLKGSVLRNDYPRPFMREMADVDILIDSSRAGDVRIIMEKLGFTVHQLGIDHHDTYLKKNACEFEIHRLLFGSSMRHELRTYYRDIFHHLNRDKGARYRFHFSSEDFYIYMTAHEYKHDHNGGIGLRSLMDTYVFLQNHTLDMDYVAAETEKLGLSTFEADVRTLTGHVFSEEPLSMKEQKMLDRILGSGAHGTLENKVSSLINEKGRWVFFLSRLTLPYERMLEHYPILRRCPLLYPFCWAHRLITAFHTKPGVVLYQFKAIFGGNKDIGSK